MELICQEDFECEIDDGSKLKKSKEFDVCEVFTNQDELKFIDKEEIFKLVCSCSQNCIRNITNEVYRKEGNFKQSIDLVYAIRREFMSLDRKEKNIFLAREFDKCIVNRAGIIQRANINYTIGRNDMRHGFRFSVCSTCFDNVYGISESYRKRILARLKKDRNVKLGSTDRSSVPPETVKQVKSTSQKGNFYLSREEMARINMANTRETLTVGKIYRCYKCKFYHSPLFIITLGK